jgi:hypothetical protein
MFRISRTLRGRRRGALAAAAFLDPLPGRPVNQGYVRVPKTRFPAPARRRYLDRLPLGEQSGPPIAEPTRIAAEAIDSS